MPRLIWTPEALADVARLHQFLADNNRDAAKRAVSVIRSGVRLLAQHPEAGRPMDQMPDGYREWSIAFGSAGYLALYHFSGEDVVILAIRHVREQGY
jgi:plasmid stabilization system protein ParE